MIYKITPIGLIHGESSCQFGNYQLYYCVKSPRLRNGKIIFFHHENGIVYCSFLYCYGLFLYLICWNYLGKLECKYKRKCYKQKAIQTCQFGRLSSRQLYEINKQVLNTTFMNLIKALIKLMKNIFQYYVNENILIKFWREDF